MVEKESFRVQNGSVSYTRLQLIALLALRFVIGWHIFYEGISKALIPQWTSTEFLKNSQWILSGFFEWILENPSVLSVVDFLNIWGLMAIGAGIMLGLFFRVASISGCVLVLMYYLATPPLIGMEYTLPMEGSNLIINKTLIEAVALLVLAVFPTSRSFGLDYFLRKQIS